MDNLAERLVRVANDAIIDAEYQRVTRGAPDNAARAAVAAVLRELAEKVESFGSVERVGMMLLAEKIREGR